MTAYLSKQHSCFSELDGRGDGGEVPYSYNWHQHQQPGSHHHHFHHHHHHHQQPGQRYHYASVPGGATLPRRGGRLAAWHFDSMSSRSPSHLASVRAKGGSCDLWPTECGCLHNWHEPYQVKARSYLHWALVDPDFSCGNGIPMKKDNCVKSSVLTSWHNKRYITLHLNLNLRSEV